MYIHIQVTVQMPLYELHYASIIIIHLVARYLSDQSQQEQSSQAGTQASHPMSASSDGNEPLFETLFELEHNQPDTAVAML